MEGFLNSLYSGTSVPVLSAIILGLLTAISPCPMATNITAIGFISRDIENRNRVFLKGLVYTLGRAIAYTGLATIIYLGADHLELKGIFQKYGEKVIGPVLIIIGIYMLGIFNINFPSFNRLTKGFESKSTFRFWDVLLIGFLFALAFCPYSGVLYFGLLIPLTIKTSAGLYLPVVYAVATSILVIVIAWALAYMVSGVGKLYNNLKKFDFWFKKLIAVLFICVGAYYTYYAIWAIF